ncbi:MAG TPA: hypothetical protein VGI81_18820 [Tepidisphaeraceae bacterium]|jgi:hypothetical protein
MNRPDQVNPDSILDELSTRQHLHPHRSLQQILAEAQRKLGFCMGAAQAAIAWLRLDASLAVGRLRRSELIQLARSIHRFWRQALADSVPQSQLT